GLVPAKNLPTGLISPNATVWLGPGRHFVHYYVRGGELVNFVGVVETDRWTNESWSQRGDVADLAADFAGWHPVVETLIAATEEAYRWALYDRDPLPSWTRGNISLLGDACHPMLPYLAQGAAMAIEDAWVLSIMLERWEDEPARGLAEYERYRRPRTGKVQLASRAQGKEFHLRERLPVLQRNLKLALGSRFLPEMAMQQFDWLHGYDCIRGFE
ncbi:MAG: FAD-dependent monooxygenase, partial [Pseudomonadales bacterium]